MTVHVIRDAGWMTLTLADCGPGIAPELRNRLFQPFSAGNARTGSGLGLAICHEIVSALGGTIAPGKPRWRTGVSKVSIPPSGCRWRKIAA